MGSVTEVYFNDDKALAHLSPKIVQINTVAAAGRRDVRGRGGGDVTAVHHLYDFRRWRCPNGGAKELRKVADPGLMRNNFLMLYL